MSDGHDVLTAVYKAGVRNEIEETKAVGEPAAVNVLPSDADADALLWMKWDAATRDSILLYDGSEVYEKHVDDLAWPDSRESGAFHYLLARAHLGAGEQHIFTGEVMKDLGQLGDSDA